MKICKYAKLVQCLQYKKTLPLKLNAELVGICLYKFYIVIVYVLSLNLFKMLPGTRN